MGKPPQDDQPGGFFARARELARQQRDEPKTSTPYVLKCPTCGAARQRMDLTCRFCGGQTTE